MPDESSKPLPAPVSCTATAEDLMAFADWVPQLMWMADSRGNAIYLNRRWLDYASHAEGYIDPNTIVVHPEDLEAVTAAWWASVATGTLFEQEYRLQRKDGAFRWHLVRAVATEDPSTGKRRWFGTCTDIDDERTAREARIEAGQQLRNASLENARLKAFIGVQQDIATADHEPEKLMLLIAERLQQHAHADGAGVAIYEGDEVSYRACIGSMQPLKNARPRKTDSEVGRILATGRPLHVVDAATDPRLNTQLVAKTGTHSCMMAPLMVKGCIIGYLIAASNRARAFSEGALHEMELLTNLLATALTQAEEAAAKQATITALRAAEKDLVRARQVAEQAARMKAEFLANMSHEIRTPLNGIIGLADILIDTGLTEDQKRYVGMVQKSGNTLLTVVNDVLDFSKIDAGKLDIEEVTFDIAQLVNEQATLMAARARDKNIDLSVYLDPRLPRALRGDAGRVAQVLLNLLNNAIKFTHAGSVSIRARAIEMNDTRVITRISVTDSGVGIDPETQKRLFTPFTQADGSTARRFGGTGLGLSICKRLVELMSGAIGVSSQASEGSTFWFTLPFPRAGIEMERVAVVPVQEALSGRVRGRVLVAEDNAVNQLIAATMLKGLGYTAHTVANGVEALAALAMDRYDLVLMDCQMPEMDGFATTRHIRDLERRAGVGHMPIVALTANAMREDEMRCRASGMDDHLAKPIKRAQLGAALERWIPPRAKA